MKVIGLLMVAYEDDILERTLAHNAKYVDVFYALDGTVPNSQSEHIISKHPKCAGYSVDADLPRPLYPRRPVDGYRQFLYEQAVADHGHDNLFVLLHGDEIWTGDPRVMADGNDGWLFQLPFYFPRAGEAWDYNIGPLEQLSWHLAPGFPEFRMFRGGADVRYDEAQHFNVRPKGIRKMGCRPEPILHFPFRSPDVQITRADHHQKTGFDPDNYEHVIEDRQVYWTDGMIADWSRQACFAHLRHADASTYLRPLAVVV